MLINELAAQFKIKNLRLERAAFFAKKKLLECTFITDQNVDEDLRIKMMQHMEHASGVSVTLKIKRNILDEYAIKHACLQYIHTNIKTLTSFINLNDISVQISYDVIIDFSLGEVARQLFDAAGAAQKIEADIAQNFFCSSRVSISKKPERPQNNELILEMQRRIIFEKNAAVQKPTPFFALSGVEKFIGENNFKTAELISNCTKPGAFVNLCGEVDFITRREFDKKVKGEIVKKAYITFVLRDGKGSKINCTFFGSASNVKKLERIAGGTKISAYGTIDMFRDRLSFKPKTIALLGDYVYNEAQRRFRGVPENFLTIFPKQYLNFKQAHFFEEEIKSNKLAGRNLVVFDLETTGLNCINDKIIEIGAVKIENGNIVQTFSTLINPQQEISAEITKITGIDNEMVANAPLLSTVIGDFYKFCNGCELVAYNSEFDMGFLRIAALEHNYYFDNTVIDALAVARRANLGTANHRLGTVLEKLKITNDEAHRALSDALATAKLLIAIADEAM